MLERDTQLPNISSCQFCSSVAYVPGHCPLGRRLAQVPGQHFCPAGPKMNLHQNILSNHNVQKVSNNMDRMQQEKKQADLM